MALHKILKLVTVILGIIGTIFLGFVIFKGDDYIQTTGEGVSGFLVVSYITLAITVALVVIFVLTGLFSGDVKKTFLPIIAFLVVVGLAYVMADGTPMQLREGDSISGSGAKWVDTGLISFYILAIVAIGAMVYSSVKNAIRK